jgi:hypothetical protein
MKSEKEIRKRLDQLMPQRMQRGPYSELKVLRGMELSRLLSGFLKKRKHH